MKPLSVSIKQERILSLFLAATFLFSQVLSVPISGFAQPIKTLDPISVQSLLNRLQEIPRENASVEKIKINSGKTSSPLIIHIQDAHSNPSAQRNISAVLSFLQESFPQMAVAVEGAAGRLHPEYFDLFPDYPKANQKMIDDLAAKGEISGAELFAWENYLKKKESVLFGIEDPELYRDNLKQFKSLLSSRDEIDGQLQYLRSWLATMESKMLNADLREFLKEKDRRKEGRFERLMSQGNSDLAAYLSFIVKQSKNQLGLDLDNPIEQFRFPGLVRFLILQREEKEWNPDLSQNQWKDLLQAVRFKAKSDTEKAFVQSLDLFLRKTIFANQSHRQDTGKETAYARGLVEKLARFSQKHKVGLEAFPQAIRSFRLFIFQSEIKSEELFKEVERLEAGILGKLSRTQEEKEWAGYHEALGLLEKLLHLELTHVELEKIKQDNVFKRMIEQAHLSREKELLTFVSHARDFYQTALERDQVLAGNALQGLDGKKPEVLVLITGGFHQEGIQRILEDHNLSYAVVTPAISSVDSAKIYLEVMAGTHADISVYFHDQNPFTSKRDSLFFKLILETGIPSLVKDYQVVSSQLPEILQKAVGKNPVLSHSFNVQTVKEGNSFAVRFSPKVEAPVLTPERFTIADALFSGEDYLGLTSSSVAGPLDVIFIEDAGFHVNLVAESRSEVRMQSSAVEVRSGRLNQKEIQAQARARRSELRSRPLKIGSATAVTDFTSFIQTGVRKANTAIDLSNPDVFNPRREAFTALMAEKYQGLTLGDLAKTLQGITDIGELLQSIETTEVQKKGIRKITETLMNQTPDRIVQAFNGLFYLKFWDNLFRELFESRTNNLQDNVFLTTSHTGANVRGQFFEYLAAKTIQERSLVSAEAVPAGNVLAGRSEARQTQNVQNNIQPTNAFLLEIKAAAVNQNSQNRLILRPEARLMSHIASPSANSGFQLSLAVPVAGEMGIIQTSSSALIQLKRTIAKIFGVDAHKALNPQTPAVFMVYAGFTAPRDMSEAGLGDFVQKRITLFTEGIFDEASRVELVLPVTQSDALLIQASFAKQSLIFGLPSNYVTVFGAGDEVVKESLKVASAPPSRSLTTGLLVLDRDVPQFSSRSIPSRIMAVKDGKLGLQTALFLFARRLKKPLSPEELSQREFLSLGLYAETLGLRSELRERVNLLVRTLQSFGSAA